MVEIISIVFFSYISGSIPFGLILTKIFKKQDIRTIGSGNTQTCTISRNGDLVGATYLRIRDTTFGANEGEVYDIVDYVEVEIGGQLIDRQHGDWNAIWWELSTPESKAIGLKSMLC